MTPDEMRASSQKKFQQVTELMDLLKVSFTAKDKVTKDGFIERVIVFTDDEKYPTVPPPEPEPVTENEDAPKTS